MKRNNILAVSGILSLLIVVICIYPVSAAVICLTPKVEAKGQAINVELTIRGSEQEVEISKYPLDILFLLDNSNSMADSYKGKSKLNWSKEEVISILSYLGTKSRVGIMTFSTKSNLVVPLTEGMDVAKRDIDDISIEGGETRLGDSIYHATKILLDRNRNSLPIMIILTDGNYIGGLDPIKAAEDAAKEKITIYTIGVGDKIDEGILMEIADKGKGSYARITDTDKIRNAISKDRYYATGIDIEIEQDQAIIDYSSIKHTSTYGSLKRIDKTHYTCSKLGGDEELNLKFNAFYPGYESGIINIAKVKISYLNTEGKMRDNITYIKANIENPLHLLAIQKKWTSGLGISAFIVGAIAVFIWIRYLFYKNDIDAAVRRVEREMDINKDRKVEFISDTVRSILKRFKKENRRK